jgi:hypothetical protein
MNFPMILPPRKNHTGRIVRQEEEEGDKEEEW